MEFDDETKAVAKTMSIIVAAVGCTVVACILLGLYADPIVDFFVNRLHAPLP